MADRLSKKALQFLLSGKVKQEAMIAVKFYSNGCHYCQELKKPYEDLVQHFGDEVYLYAFNVMDYPEVEDILNFQGVPTICYMRVGSRPRIRMMPEPSEPHSVTWYKIDDIKDFIEKEKEK